MQQKHGVKNCVIWIYMFIAALVVLYGLIGGISHKNGTLWNGFNAKAVTELNGGWERSINGEPFSAVTLPQTGNIANADITRLERILPQKVAAGSTIAIYASFQNIRIYLSGKLVRDYKGESGFLHTDVPVTQILFVPLKPENAGQKILIEYSSPLPSRRGVLHKVLMGNTVDVIYYLLSKRILIMLAGGLLLVIGAVLICYRMFTREKGIVREALLYQGVFVLLLGSFFILQTGMNQFLFRNLNWARYLEFFSIMLAPVTAILEMDVVEKHRLRQYADLLCICCIGMIFTECVLAIVFQIDYMKVIMYTYLMIVIAVFYAGGSIVWLYLSGEKKLLQEMKWMIYANAALAAATVGEIILYYAAPSREDCRSLACGVIFHSFFSVKWILQQKELQEVEKERSIQQAEAKSIFLANMSHEIRTPVSAILGINDMILKKVQDNEIMSYAEDINESGHSLMNLVNNILHYSRLESGMDKLVNADYRLLTLLQELADNTRSAIGKKKIVLEMKIEPSLPSVLYGDRNKIKTILGNVLQNALQYTEAGRITMDVCAEKTDRRNIMLHFCIDDTGSGMTAKERERVMERIRQIRQNAPQEKGLGLMVAGGFVRMMDGDIELLSSETGGCSVHVRIGQKISDDLQIGSYYDSDSLNEMIYMPEKKILIVDDDLINVKVLIGMLRNTGIRIDAAENGYEALQLTKDVEYDLILLDHRMPGMDGVETFNRMKEIWISKKTFVPVIMLSAELETGQEENYISLGFADFLLKPVKENVLIQMVEKFLREKAW
ncbi:MAG: response regulator [Butyrivibrio sp.]|nr:response regulator [Butyrivibrio sp.]